MAAVDGPIEVPQEGHSPVVLEPSVPVSENWETAAKPADEVQTGVGVEPAEPAKGDESGREDGEDEEEKETEKEKEKGSAFKRTSHRKRSIGQAAGNIRRKMLNKTDYKTKNEGSGSRYGSLSAQTLARHAISFDVLKSVILDLDLMVVLSLVVAIVFTYICDRYDIEWNVNLTVLVSPLVFPLAFSINASYQRREKVLDDLANFKSAAAILYFCHRDWAPSAGLSDKHPQKVLTAIVSLVDTLLKYVTHRSFENRRMKLRKCYRIFSKIARLNEIIRGSCLPTNAPLVARIIHEHNVMILSFERLRTVREYLTPRGIRNFFKFFIFIFPIAIAPYFVYAAHEIDSEWGAYYGTVITTFIFGSLQSVQDALDDPFDGVGEDDIDLSQIAAWPHMALWANPELQPPTDEVVDSQYVSTAMLAEQPDQISDCTEESEAEDDPDYIPVVNGYVEEPKKRRRKKIVTRHESAPPNMPLPPEDDLLLGPVELEPAVVTPQPERHHTRHHQPHQPHNHQHHRRDRISKGNSALSSLSEVDELHFKRGGHHIRPASATPSFKPQVSITTDGPQGATPMVLDESLASPRRPQQKSARRSMSDQVHHVAFKLDVDDTERTDQV